MRIALGKKILVGLGVTAVLVEQYLKKALEELKKLNKELELSVEQKTVQLEKTNAILKEEIAERKQAEKKMGIINDRLRGLSARLQSVREDERTRIAREIHDELGQQLTGLKMDLHWVNKRLNKEQQELQNKIKTMMVLVDETVQSVRKISTDLRPGILDLGLLAAIEWQCNEFEKRSGIKCKLETELYDLHCNNDISTAVFRIFQETLTNIARHSAASILVITIKVGGADLLMEMKDNGKGITETEINNTESLGLLGMKERAHIFGGELSIEGIAEQGTSVKLKIPLSL